MIEKFVSYLSKMDSFSLVHFCAVNGNIKIRGLQKYVWFLRQMCDSTMIIYLSI